MTSDPKDEMASEVVAAEANLSKSPLDPEALQLLGRVYLKHGRAPDAEVVLRLSIVEDPTDAFTHLYLGNAFYAQADYPSALESFQQARQLAPELAVPCSCLSDTYHALGDVESAGRFYRKAFQLEPDDPIVIRNAARWKKIEDGTLDDEA